MIDCQQRCMHLRSMVVITVALILLACPLWQCYQHQYSTFRLLSVRVTACWWGRYLWGVQMRMSTQHVDGIPTTGMLHKLRSADSGRARSLGIALSGRCVRHPMARSRLKVAWVRASRGGGHCSLTGAPSDETSGTTDRTYCTGMSKEAYRSHSAPARRDSGCARPSGLLARDNALDTV